MRSKTVMVIEDEKPIRTYTSRLLQAEGYSVVEVETGFQGLASVEHTLPMLILCDVNLKDMSGFEVLHSLRQRPGNQQIPFLFLTGHTWAADMQTDLKLRADQFLLKPVIRTELLAAVAARLASPDAQSVSMSKSEKPSELQGTARARWMFDTIIRRRLSDQYVGWWVAVEHETGRCFLGRSERDALTIAKQSMPDREFLPVSIHAPAVA